MAAPMEVSLPQTMLQKLLDLLKLESLKFCIKIHVHVICTPIISAAICGELPKLSETDAERSTGVALLSAAESNCPKLERRCEILTYIEPISQN